MLKRASPLTHFSPMACNNITKTIARAIPNILFSWTEIKQRELWQYTWYAVTMWKRMYNGVDTWHAEERKSQNVHTQENVAGHVAANRPMKSTSTHEGTVQLLTLHFLMCAHVIFFLLNVAATCSCNKVRCDVFLEHVHSCVSTLTIN